MNVRVYRRVSTEEQAESGLGLEAQSEQCRLWVEKNEPNAVVVDYVDEGRSGSKGIDAREGLPDLLRDLQPGDVVLVAKRDRVARDVPLLCLIEKDISRRKARLVSAAGEGTEDDDPGSVLYRRIVDAFAEHERLLIISRTRAALAAKKRRGERTGKVPFGYALDGNKLRPVEEHLQAIQRMREYRDSGLSWRSIASIMDVECPIDRPWRHTSVQCIVEREANSV